MEFPFSFFFLSFFFSLSLLAMSLQLVPERFCAVNGCDGMGPPCNEWLATPSRSRLWGNQQDLFRGEDSATRLHTAVRAIQAVRAVQIVCLGCSGYPGHSLRLPLIHGCLGLCPGDASYIEDRSRCRTQTGGCPFQTPGTTASGAKGLLVRCLDDLPGLEVEGEVMRPPLLTMMQCSSAGLHRGNALIRTRRRQLAGHTGYET